MNAGGRAENDLALTSAEVAWADGFGSPLAQARATPMLAEKYAFHGRGADDCRRSK